MKGNRRIVFLLNWAISMAVCQLLLQFSIGFAGENPEQNSKVELIQYDDAITLCNSAAYLTVSPSVGRIVSFGQKDKPDILWRNVKKALPSVADAKSWANYGGDKVWPAPELIWVRACSANNGWLPDKRLDGSPWQVVRASDNEILMESPVSNDYQLKIIRQITLEPDRAAVTIRNTFQSVGICPFPVNIWSVTQIVAPQYCLLGIAEYQPYPYHPFIQLSPAAPPYSVCEGGGSLQVFPLPGKYSKMGTLGNWVAAVYPDCILKETTVYDPNGCYPDRASIEVYWNALSGSVSRKEFEWNSDYVELETISATVHLKKGETLKNEVRWEIINRPKGANAEAVLRESVTSCSPTK